MANKKDIVDNELFITLVMQDGSILNEAKLGFLDSYGHFDWITDIDILKSVVGNSMDKRPLAFSTKYIQGHVIKEKIKSINVQLDRILLTF